MTTLLNINSVKIIKYLFLERKDILIKMAYHSYRKSIAETLCKIIKYENKLRDDSETYDDKQFSLIRLEIIEEIFDKIDINMDSEKLFSISFIINDLTDDKKILEAIIGNKNIINSFINKQLKDLDLISESDEAKLDNMKNNFIIISDIIINWLNNIKNNDTQIPMLLYEVNDFDDEDGNQNEDIVQQKEVDNTPPEVHHTILSQALFDVLPNLIQKNFNKRSNNEENKEKNYMVQSYNDFKLVPLGLHRIKIVEILTNLIPYFKNISNDYDNLLINSNFLENSINYIFEYEWNNIYQEAMYQFFKQLFKYDKDFPYHEISSSYLFSKLGLLNIIITNFTKNKSESNNDNNSRHGYIPLLVSLSYKINSLIGGNYIKLNKNNAREGSFSFINEGRDLFGNNALDIFFNMSLTNNNNNENKKEEVEPVSCLKKYCSEEWNKFFSENIVNLVNLYEEKLCQQKVSVNVSFGENDDLFAKDDNNNETEALLGTNNDNENKNEENNNDDLVNTNDEVHKKNKEMAKFKDMEINLNDFNFTNDNEDKTDEHNKKDDVDSKEEKAEEDKKEVIEENKGKGEEKKEEEVKKEEVKKEEVNKEEIKEEEVKKEEEKKEEESKKEEVKKEEEKKEEESKKEEVKREEAKKEEVTKEEIIGEEAKKEEVTKEEIKKEEENKEVQKIEEKKEEKIEDKKEEGNKEENNKGNEDNTENESKNNEIINEKEKKTEMNEEDKKENEDKD